MKKLILVLIVGIFLINSVNALSENEAIDSATSYLREKLGGDYFETYFIGNTKAVYKTLQGFGPLGDIFPVNAYLLYFPFRIEEDVITEVEVIVFEKISPFETENIYSRISEPVWVNVTRDEAVKLAKERNIVEPFEVAFIANDNFFGWYIKSSVPYTESNYTDYEGIAYLTLDIRTGETQTESIKTYQPIAYEPGGTDNQMVMNYVSWRIFYLLFGMAIFIIVIIGAVWVYKKRGKFA